MIQFKALGHFEKKTKYIKGTFDSKVEWWYREYETPNLITYQSDVFYRTGSIMSGGTVITKKTDVTKEKVSRPFWKLFFKHTKTVPAVKITFTKEDMEALVVKDLRSENGTDFWHIVPESLKTSEDE